VHTSRLIIPTPETKEGLNTMEQVVDVIQQNLPWKVGPMQGSFEDPDNDIKAQTTTSTLTSAARYDCYDAATAHRKANFSGTQYDLGDEDMAMAAAAAAAAVAMQHNQPAKKLPREQIQEVFQTVRVTCQSQLQHQTPRRFVKSVREQTPQLVQKVVKNVRGHVNEVWNGHYAGSHPQDIASEEPTSDYSDSLNEQQSQHCLYQEERREQPPETFVFGKPQHNLRVAQHLIQRNCFEFGHHLQESSLVKKLPTNVQASLVLATTTLEGSHSQGSFCGDPNEFYVNFSDGNAHDAVEEFTAKKKQIDQAEKSQSLLVSPEGYADLQDETVQQEKNSNNMKDPTIPPAEHNRNSRKNSPQKKIRGSSIHSIADYEWDTRTTTKCVLPAQVDESTVVGTDDDSSQEENASDNSVTDSMDTRNCHPTVAMHSTANFHLGAAACPEESASITQEAKQEREKEKNVAFKYAENGIEANVSKIGERDKRGEEAFLPEKPNEVAIETKMVHHMDLLSKPPPSVCVGEEALNSSFEKDRNKKFEAAPEAPDMHSAAKFHWGSSSCKAASS